MVYYNHMNYNYNIYNTIIMYNIYYSYIIYSNIYIL